ncbi:MAG: nitrilase-related carbon-nitrogen hydrolase [Phycisphaeraceae bacterium]
MQIVAVQQDIVWENKQANCDHAAAMLREAKVAPGSLVVLAEMFATGFSINLPATTEGDNRPTEKFVQGLAKELDSTVIAGVVNDASPGKGFNEAVVFGPGGEVARYRKMRPFTLGKEYDAHDAGDEAISFKWHDAVVSPFVCYDLRFPEVMRGAARLGAEIICVIASWPEARYQHWIRLLQARGIENQCYVVGVNRCGKDPFLSYKGRSIIVDWNGDIVADAGEGEAVIRAEIDLKGLREYRAKLPFLADMR